ncbi:MAG TPA: ABC transporter permease [Thermodesulfovibrionales bacterium]|nr:ABC transporter permease [Thermodesulfovibrionales bacterium]
MASRLNILLFAMKNLRRKIVRALLLILAVSVVTGTLFTATLFISSMQNALKTGTYRLGADVLVVPEKYISEARAALLAGEPTNFYMDSSVLDKVKAVEGVKAASPQLFIKPASFNCCFSVEAFLVAFDPSTDFTVTAWLETNIKKTLVGNEVITGRNIPVISGDIIPFFGTSFKVAGTMEPTGMKFFDQSVFMTMDAAYQMAANSRTKSQQPITIEKDKISAVLVQVKEGFSSDGVSTRVERDIVGVKAIASSEVISAVRKQLGGLLKGMLAIGAVLWALALIMMGFAFSMMVNERQRELGLLRSMGAKKKHILSLIVTEALIISSLGGIIGLISGSVLLSTFKNLMLHSLRLPYLLPPLTTLVELVSGAVIFSLLTGLLASLLPAVSASMKEPYEAIRKGE